ncbi:crossover junction endodeoxyribonuclease RuvC [Rhodococcus sp. IEGM 1366]|uniref:crossover junction endodeoxyribonuclease RuvC n=1 Tax=Rhodococcus sp. IEGM 1366 TaxID=3082223 RepID=UPI00295467F6|nr:crossover junction endodeoxyribonuclease RuvC [Rhodococcus sp. IEGM 1366]MDV8066406.1 crossover junction endodeoxyribonuclease RuvC [Rhodococcus sp. IEGM 1366]
MSTTVVGIDPSLTGTGIAILGHPKTAESPNVPILTTVKTEKRGTRFLDRANRISQQIEQIWKAMPPLVRLVVIEDLPVVNPMPGAASAYQDRSALIIALGAKIQKAGLPLVAVNLSTLKLFAAGNGHAKKPEMIEAMKFLWPHADIGKDDNRADALALATMGAFHLGWHEPELPHHYTPKVNWPNGSDR